MKKKLTPREELARNAEEGMRDASRFNDWELEKLGWSDKQIKEIRDTYGRQQNNKDFIKDLLKCARILKKEGKDDESFYVLKTAKHMINFYKLK